MQYIKNGPDIPDALIHEHEEGRVVFFCGAGISYASGLPGFQQLVDCIYESIGDEKNALESQTYKRNQLDSTLDLLENRVDKSLVRNAVHSILQPDLSKTGAKDIHNALLDLSKTRQGIFRLVTTNFDRIFEKLINEKEIDIPSCVAPLLPVPKENRWEGLIYLHGLLPEKPKQSEFGKLVYTSGDFGRAYLVERWAARFVSELFRNYTVCFVGYSINDPILRYMMDAIAADKNLGLETPESYAFAGYNSNKSKQACQEEWAAKHVTPILYKYRGKSHKVLSQSLVRWSQTYRDGINAKEQIVNEYAAFKPTQSNTNDDFVKRLIWAVSDPSGLPAKAFSQYQPTPTLDWLPIFESKVFDQDDLSRFGIHCDKAWNGKIGFSLLQRPSPYKYAEWMNLFESFDRKIDEPMSQLLGWLCKNMHDARLIHWILKHGGQIPENAQRRFQWGVEENQNIPESIKLVWRLLLAGNIRVFHGHRHDFYQWIEFAKKHGVDFISRQQLVEFFNPKYSVKAPFGFNQNETATSNGIEALFDIEVVFVGSVISHYFEELKTLPLWESLLLDLVLEWDRQLLQCMQYWEVIGKASEEYDPSHYDLPSISDHWQNRNYHEWVILIQILRDSWLAHFQSQSEEVNQLLGQWLKRKFPVYRRLALFAANQNGMCENGEWVDWILEKNQIWLWSVQTQREVMRLLVEKGSRLPSQKLKELVDSVLEGPSRDLFVRDLDDEEFNSIRERSIWLRLSKLDFGGCTLPEVAQSYLKSIRQKHPGWKLSNDPDRDDFSHWMSGTGDPDWENEAKYINAPRTAVELANWLLNPIERSFYEVRDDWREICDKEWELSKEALEINVKKGKWPIDRWRSALQVWSKDRDAYVDIKQWNQIAELILKSPDEEFKQLNGSLTWWIESNSKGLSHENELFISICRRVLEANWSIEEKGLPTIQSAINHPIGRITEALIRSWFGTNPTDGSGIPITIRTLFEMITNASENSKNSGLLIIAEYAISLFRTDEKWTSEHILPYFQWSGNNEKTFSCWRGFLVSPRNYMPVLMAIRENFIVTAKYLDQLQDVKKSYIHFFAFLCLSSEPYFSKEEIQTTLKNWTQVELNEFCESLQRFQGSAGDQKEQYFLNRLLPFWKSIWPKDKNLHSGEISISVAKICIASGSEFPTAIMNCRSWINNSDDAHMVYYHLEKSEQCQRFPEESLELISLVFNDNLYFYPNIATCLAQIVEAKPELKNDQRYIEIIKHKGKL